MSLVEIKNVTKRFGDVTVLDDVSLNIEAGETISIIGRSGSGKSTLLRCINGLEPIQGGSIIVDGVRVTILLRIYAGCARTSASYSRATISSRTFRSRATSCWRRPW